MLLDGNARMMGDGWAEALKSCGRHFLSCVSYLSTLQYSVTRAGRLRDGGRSQ